ncbi:MAG: PAS domain S-box protein [Ferruginibacter sp.]
MSGKRKHIKLTTAGLSVIETEQQSDVVDSSNFYYQIMHEALQPCFCINAYNIITDVNIAAAALVEFNPVELVGKSIDVLLPLSTVQRMPFHIKQLPDYGQISILNRSGKTLHCSYVNIFNHEVDEAAQYCLMIKDLTIEQLLTSHLSKSYNRFREMLEANAELFMLINPSACLVYVSKSVEDALQLNKGALHMVPFTTFVHPDDKYLFIACFEESLEKPMQAIPVKCRQKRTDGSCLWIEGTFTNMLHVEGVYAVVADFKDVSAIKESEAELIDSNSEIRDYKYALDESSIVAITDQAGLIIYANENFSRISGYSTEELIGQNHRILNSGYHPKQFFAELWATIKQGRVWRGELRNKAKDGHFYWVDSTIVPFLNKEGKPYQYLALRKDITDRKLKEEQLRLSNERFEYVTHATSDAIWDWNIEANTLYYSEVYQKLFGHKISFLLQQQQSILESLIYKDDRERVVASLNEAIENGSADWQCEYRFKKADKSYAFVLNKGILLKNAKGKVYRIIGALQDISLQKKEEQELKLFESVITNATDSIMITDAKIHSGKGPRMVYVNDAFLKMTHYTKAEVMGKSPRMFQGPLSDRSALSKMKSAIVNKEHCDIETVNYTKEGEPYWVSFSVVPLLDNNGNTTHYISIQRDITERKKQEFDRNVIFESIHAFNSEVLSEAWETLFSLVCKHCGFDYAEAWSVNYDFTNLVLDYSTSSDASIQQLIKNRSPHKVFKGKGITGKVWDSKQILFVNDLQNHPDYVSKLIIEESGLNHAAFIPLVSNDETIAVIVFFAKQPIKEVARFTSLFEQLSHQIGVNLQRRRAEDELQRFFDLSPDLLGIASKEGQFKKINTAFQKILGFEKNAILSSSFLSFVHPSDYFITTEALTSIHSGTPVLYFENRFITATGQVKWFAWTLLSLPKDGLIFSIAKEITDKKNAEKVEKELRLRFEAIFNGAQDAILLTTVKGRFVQVNPAAALILGYTQEELLSLSLDDIVLRFNEVKATTDSSSETLPFEGKKGIIELKRKDGSEIICQYNTSANILTGLNLSVLTDITELEHSRREINSQKSKIENILNSIGDAFFTVNKEWTITYWNNIAENQMGISRDAAIGKKIWDIAPLSESEKLIEYFNNAFNDHLSITFEMFNAAISKWFEFNIYPFDNGLSIYARDINDRKIAGDKMNLLNVELSRKAQALSISNAELERFAYVASHDLQEPLRMVSSFLQLLEKKYGNKIDDLSSQYIHFAVDGAERMKRLINDLLHYSRTGNDAKELVEVNMNEVVNEVIQICSPNIEITQAEINFHDLPTVFAGKTAMVQLLQNLIGNALKYRKADQAPQIQISCTSADNEWVFCVSDNGIGIDTSFKDKIFIIFQRLHNRDEYSGTGIGLAICKKIIDIYNGRIWVESLPGQGSQFFFTIPR